MCAICCVRGPRESTGRIFVRGSMASHSQSTWVELRNLVRSSSNGLVREVQVAEGVLMEEFRVLACSREPPRNRGVSKAEHPPCSRKIQSFGQSREHHRDRAREGVFSRYKGVSRRARERGAARLTAKGLDALGMAMFAIAHQRVTMRVRVAEVRALPVRTGEALGGDALRSSPPAFDLGPRTYR
jgi:hypothetical protein